MSTPITDFLARLETLIREETRRQREHLERQWALPLGERVHAQQVGAERQVESLFQSLLAQAFAGEFPYPASGRPF